jgi:glycerol-3-phosphate dehydrogenase (NAD(P)+)
MGIQAGANPMTFAGLAGFGDLMATASSSLSRNRYLGEELGKGKTVDEIRESMHNVTEGVDSTSAALMMADRYNVDIPITKTIYRILFEGLDPSSAAKELLARAPQPELNTGL